MDQSELQRFRPSQAPPVAPAGMFSANDDLSPEMATTIATLMPRAGNPYLKTADVVSRIRAKFAYVETSKDGAGSQVLEWMSQLMFVAPGGRAAAADEYLAQLERLQDDALFIHFGNDLSRNGLLLNILFIPGQPLVVDCSAYADQAVAQTLVARCAAALGYDIVEQGSAATAL
jgi:hypothetical protein